MKKMLLVLLMCIVAINGFTATISQTIQVGETITISPVRPGKGYNFANSFQNTNEAVANVLVEKTSGYSETIGQNDYGPITVHYDRYQFKITGLKAGTSTIKLGYTNSSGNFTEYKTYIITVADVKSISIPISFSLTLGETYTFSPIITDAEAITTLSWNSSNTSVASVDANGSLTTTGLGITTITCTAHNGVSAQCVVTVNPVLVNGIALNESEAELTVGDNLQLDATIVPDNATDKSVTWSSTNESVAVVGENGLVTAVGSGTCQIKALANDGSGKTASCLVTVEKNNKLTVGNMTLCRGGQGTMHVLLTDEEVVSGFQFDLAVPAGVTVPTDKDGQLKAKLGSRASSHNITASKVSEGLYRFIVVSMTNKPITQGEDDVMTITLEAASDMATQQYDVTLQNIGLTVKQGNDFVEIHPRNNTAKLTVTDVMPDVTPGDVNGDGKVSVTDVISIVSYVLEEEPTRFIFNAADVNGDGNVTVTDAVIVIDMILNKQ